MQDEFDFLNGANSIYKKDMCISPVVPLEPQLESSIENNDINYNGNVDNANLPSLTRNEGLRSKDLFSSHPTTWKQHLMNGQEHSRHRLQSGNNEQRHKRRLNLTTSKLLLQNSDDPLICHGANNVGTGEDENHLIISTAQNEENIQTVNPLSSSSTTIKLQKLPSSTRCKQLLRKLPQNGCSLLTKQQLKVKAGLMSVRNRAASNIDKSGHMCTDVAQANKTNDLKLSKKKGVLKLRFHHQALPPEYLIHYEATQGQLTPYAKELKAKSSEFRSSKDIQSSKLSPAKNGHENVRNWLQKIAAIHRSSQEAEMEQNEKIHGQQQTRLELPKTEVYNDTNNNYQVSRMLPSNPGISYVPAVKNEIRFERKHSYNSEMDQVHSLKLKCTMNKYSSNATTFNTINSASLKRVINFADLPYMGEITLDNSKPRRGRKPKKADICHLIYKNYGTILPGTPNSLLNTSNLSTEGDQKHGIVDELPLNLCIRDQQCEHLSISSAESENARGIDDVDCINTLHSNVENFVETKSTTLIPSSDLKGSVILKVESDVDTKNSTPLTPSFLNPDQAKLAESHSNHSNLHPISLYYQKLLSGTLVNTYNQPFGLPVETIEKDNQLSLKIPIPSGLIRMSKTESISPTLSLNSQTIDYTDLMSTPSSIKSENSSITATISATATAAAATINPNIQIFTPQKRKRSAIFIPPIPAEITSNTPTEVSICKFKFTGGDKPTLEEKKMLSVDSGGNYRYYSGTGDKSTRGYEYFPRESLQNSAGFLPGVNCVVSCPNSENECSLNDIPPPSAELSNEILQIPESPTANLLSPASVSLTELSMPLPTPRLESSYSCSPVQSTQQQPQKIQIILGSNYSNDIPTRSTSSIKDKFANLVVKPITCHYLHPKKKSRRSTELEKLEKTFKEKGFLIQTQQLESAEGATYCKFRQLKKFTRYLFRNWKDYLPEEVHQSNVVEETTLTHQPLTKNEMKNKDNAVENFTDQDVQNILECHGFVTTSEVCSQNSTSVIERKLCPDRNW